MKRVFILVLVIFLIAFVSAPGFSDNIGDYELKEYKEFDRTYPNYDILSKQRVVYENEGVDVIVEIIEYDSSSSLLRHLNNAFSNGLERRSEGDIIYFSYEGINGWVGEDYLVQIMGLNSFSFEDDLVSHILESYPADYSKLDPISNDLSIMSDMDVLATTCSDYTYTSCSDLSEEKRVGDTRYECNSFGAFWTQPYCWEPVALNGDSDFCSTAAKCGYEQYDCDFDSQCSGDLKCKGEWGGGLLDGCCNADEGFSQATESCCVMGYTDEYRCSNNNVERKYILESCLSEWRTYDSCSNAEKCEDNNCVAKTCSDFSGTYGSCNDEYGLKRDGNDIFECKDQILGFGYFLCWDKVSTMGSLNFCDKLTRMGLTCDYNEYDCDSDSECGPGLECVGTIVGEDGCCNPGEGWDDVLHQCYETQDSKTNLTYTFGDLDYGLYRGEWNPPITMVDLWSWESDDIDYTKRPVLLVHGWGNNAQLKEIDSGNEWGYLQYELEDQNYQVWRLQYSPANTSNQKIAGMIDDAIDKLLSYGYDQHFDEIDVISHSMGGLAVRGYIQGMAENQYEESISYGNNIRKYVIIASPMGGSFFANIIDGITNLDIESNHPNCQKLIDGTYAGASSNLKGGTDATKNMQIGSDYTWDLNTKSFNYNVDYLAIAGRKTLNRASTIANIFNMEYCLSNGWETNDGLVSLYSSSLINKNYPIILMDRFHTSTWDLINNEVGIGDSRRVGKLISLFLKDNLDINTAEDILNSLGNTDEFYYDPLSSQDLPFQLDIGGGIVIDIKNSEISESSLELRPLFSSSGYPMEQNSLTGRWFYTPTSDSTGNYILFTNILPSQHYTPVINNNDYPGNIFIADGVPNMIGLDLDQDSDGYDMNEVGGSDCDDSDPFINPGVDDSSCNDVDENCDGVDDDGYVGVVIECGLGECYNQGSIECLDGMEIENCIPNDPVIEICDGLDNNCDGQVDEDLIEPTENQWGLCINNVQNCVDGSWIVDSNNYIPEDEICGDGLDNNCDGDVDENCDPDLECFSDDQCADFICFGDNSPACDLDINECYCKPDTPIDFPIIFISPEEESYNTRRMPLEVASEVECDLGYTDYVFDLDEIIETGLVGDEWVPEFKVKRPRRLCKNCDWYDRVKSFKDGVHALTVMCIDDPEINNSIFFVVDSKKPRISKTYPKKNSFTNGSDFMIKYTENFPVEFGLLINGEQEAFKYSDLEGDEGDVCPKGKNQECYFDIDLSSYDGEKIYYSFGIIDVGWTDVYSKNTFVTVDTTSPVILNPDSFWEQGVGKKNKYVYFDIEIDEDNFDKVIYIDLGDRRPKWKKLCSKLKDGHCLKKKSFRKGVHDVDLQIIDEAGNSVEIEMDVFSV